MEKVLQNHNKIVRINGQVFKIIAHKLGKRVLANAEVLNGPNRGELLDLKASRANIVKDIRVAIGLNLVS